MKSNRLLSAGSALLLSALLAGCAAATDWKWTGGERLDPCTAKGSPFENMDIKQWPKTYHDTVGGIIEAHLERLGNVSGTPIDCSADDYPEMMMANGALASLAQSLGPWKGKKKISELELAPILLEYLRVYECSLEERNYFLSIDQLGKSSAESSPAKAVPIGEYNKRIAEEKDIIDRELASARPILERTLSIAGGLDRLSPLAMDIECIKRTSLDLRNTLGLTAEAASCMPRIWDTRGGLFDLPKKEE